METRPTERALEAMEASMDGMAILDSDGRYVWVNQAHADLYGYDDPDELVGEDWSILYSGQELVRFKNEILPKLEQEGNWRGSATGRRRDGTQFPQELSLSQLDDGGLVCVVRDVTDREEQRRELEWSKRTVELAESVAGVGHWVWWLEDDEVQFSPGLYRLTGLDPEETEPSIDAFLDAVHAEDRDTVQQVLEEAADTLTGSEYECRLEPADEEEPPRVAGRVQVDPDTYPPRMLGTIVDVSELRAAEAGRARVERRLAMLMEQLPIALIEVQGHPLEEGGEFSLLEGGDVFGSAEDAIREDPDSFFERIHPDDRETAIENTKRLFDEARPVEDVFRFRSEEEGGWIWLDGTLVPTFDDEGKVDGFVGIVRDVSERERTRFELDRHRGNLELAEEVAGIGYWSWDIPTGDVEWSAGCYEVHGKDPESFDPSFEAFLETVHEDNRERIRATMHEALEECKPMAFDYHVPVEGDRTRIVHAEGRIETDDEGRPIRAFGTAQDVTARRLEQERLERYAEELERFAYVAAHDLKEPLRHVASYVPLLERRYADDLDDEAREYIDYAVEGAQRIRRLVNEMLEYTQTGMDNVRVATVDLEHPLAEAVAHIETTIQTEGAEVTHGDLHEASVDPHQLRQVFQNLVSNGIKFNDSDTPRVHVETETEEDRVLVTIADNGIGIAQRHHDRVFRIFERLHSSDSYAGTGLGLAVCRRIVERHGGEIWVQSEEDLGATFCFTLPAPGTPLPESSGDGSPVQPGIGPQLQDREGA